MKKIRTFAVAAALPVALFTVAGHSASATAPPTTTTTGDAATAASLPDGYVQLVDDTGAITVGVPSVWTTVDTVPAANPDSTDQPWILATAGADLDEFSNSFVDGVLYVAFPYSADPSALMDQYQLTAGCSEISDGSPNVQDYSDGVFTGLIQVGTGCGTGDTTWNMIAASPADMSFTAVVQVQTTDPVALQTVLDTFNYDPSAMAPSVTTTAPGAVTTTTPGAVTTVAPGAVTTTTPGAVTTVAPGAVTSVAPGAATTVAPLLTDATLPLGPLEPGAVSLTDDSQSIEVSVPSAWTQTDTTGNALDDGTTVPRIVATTDLASFLPAEGVADTFSVPGVIFSGEPFAADPQALLSTYSMGASCTDGGIAPYDDGAFTGFFQTWTDCGGTATRIVTLAANPSDSSFTAFLLIQLPTDDNTSLQTVVSSFNVSGGGPASQVTTTTTA